MDIGIPKERRPFEFRVGLSPAGVAMLAQDGHRIYVSTKRVRRQLGDATTSSRRGGRLFGCRGVGGLIC
jgi:alanine dehydrogenase